jgi:hypothetical protein
MNSWFRVVCCIFREDSFFYKDDKSTEFPWEGRETSSSWQQQQQRRRRVGALVLLCHWLQITSSSSSLKFRWFDEGRGGGRPWLLHKVNRQKSSEEIKVEDGDEATRSVSVNARRVEQQVNHCLQSTREPRPKDTARNQWCKRPESDRPSAAAREETER